MASVHTWPKNSLANLGKCKAQLKFCLILYVYVKQQGVSCFKVPKAPVTRLLWARGGIKQYMHNIIAAVIPKYKQYTGNILITRFKKKVRRYNLNGFCFSLSNIRVIKNPDSTKKIFTPIQPNFNEKVRLGQWVEITKNAAIALIPLSPGR